MHLPQEERDYIGSELLRITLRELFEFRQGLYAPHLCSSFLFELPITL
jgi:hypothetical protein